jgi:hypothetical protein
MVTPASDALRLRLIYDRTAAASRSLILAAVYYKLLQRELQLPAPINPYRPYRRAAYLAKIGEFTRV